ncbi:methyltransferase domain-containing protein [Goodfellowiella coeruleoviolacea]|uniref:Protein-L-isoaspartate O-methyltransferase n=1 Tax=Goodfellowiella coeruleoviolacea TaxID=334858 RepID=A0AAE3GFI9_9PSEU|nr:methyltransferase domain-containing protein [Goodfellowiella coeruleoviolacea]MCP2167312.1 Protein-L-isoaspartate O-methyltransferase [Goodfellowiella coeruleoviolacea]
MTLTAESADHRQNLVRHLCALGAIRSPQWLAAWQSVPREAFTPEFYILPRRSPAPDLTVRYDSSHPEWLERVYRNELLITRLSEDGTPSSSSTEPSLMASMLEALDVHDGHRVLEIGTGTGYNAALLCDRLGSDRVTSVEVDLGAAGAARDALARAGYCPTVVCGDGAHGYSPNAPYDRIIATCGVGRLPAAWIEQLTPDGAILVDVGLGLAMLRRIGDMVSGPIVMKAGFMPLRSGSAVAGPPPTTLIQATSGEPERYSSAGTWPTFAQLSFFERFVTPAGNLIGMSADGGATTSFRWVDSVTGSWARADLLDDGRIEVGESGPRSLWSELAPILETWEQAGRPEAERYGLTVTASGEHRLWLDDPDGPHVWRLGD